MKEVKRIQLWSGPRNISTALMYSFAQRNDTLVIDEPLYAHYLFTTGLQHPGRAEVLQSQDQDGNRVMERIRNGNFTQPVLFCKQMTHHLVNINLQWLAGMYHVILIRDPKAVLHSYAKVIESPALSDIGVVQSYELFHFLESNQHHHLVVDAGELLKNPEYMLQAICDHIGIDFQPSMLHWQTGARPEDGIWAKHWYANVHASTGFVPFQTKHLALPPHLQQLSEVARPYYDFLFSRSIRHRDSIIPPP